MEDINEINKDNNFPPEKENGISNENKDLIQLIKNKEDPVNEKSNNEAEILSTKDNEQQNLMKKRALSMLLKGKQKRSDEEGNNEDDKQIKKQAVQIESNNTLGLPKNKNGNNLNIPDNTLPANTYNNNILIQEPEKSIESTPLINQQIITSTLEQNNTVQNDIQMNEGLVNEGQINDSEYEKYENLVSQENQPIEENTNQQFLSNDSKLINDIVSPSSNISDNTNVPLLPSEPQTSNFNSNLDNNINLGDTTNTTTNIRNETTNVILPQNVPEHAGKKKISFVEAKKEIEEFSLQIDKIEKEISQKYGVDLTKFYCVDLLPDELKMKLIEDYFNSEEIVELSKQLANS